MVPHLIVSEYHEDQVQDDHGSGIDDSPLRPRC